MAPQSIPQPKPLAAAEPRAGSGVIAAWWFRLAVLMHDRAVYRLAVALLRDASEAEDVTQEVFLSYWQHGVGVERPREWLLRVARNAAFSRFRKSGRVLSKDPAELPEISDGHDPAWHYEQHELAGELRKLVDTLPEPQRSLLVMFDVLAAGGANAGGIEGLTLMVVDTGGGDEAVFINVAGDIQPEQLGRIAAQVGMDGLFDMVPGIGGSKGP
jgi:RNA polymerase sigma factor (sigma-70 family)